MKTPRATQVMFRSGGHPFQIKVHPKERNIVLKTRVPLLMEENDISPWDDYLTHWCFSYHIGNLPFLNSPDIAFRDAIQKPLQIRFPWLARDAFLAIQRAGPFYLPEGYNQRAYQKPFWQKVGLGYLQLDTLDVWRYISYGCEAIFYKKGGLEKHSARGVIKKEIIDHLHVVMAIADYDGISLVDLRRIKEKIRREMKIPDKRLKKKIDMSLNSDCPDLFKTLELLEKVVYLEEGE